MKQSKLLLFMASALLLLSCEKPVNKTYHYPRPR